MPLKNESGLFRTVVDVQKLPNSRIIIASDDEDVQVVKDKRERNGITQFLGHRNGRLSPLVKSESNGNRTLKEEKDTRGRKSKYFIASGNNNQQSLASGSTDDGETTSDDSDDSDVSNFNKYLHRFARQRSDRSRNGLQLNENTNTQGQIARSAKVTLIKGPENTDATVEKTEHDADSLYVDRLGNLPPQATSLVVTEQTITQSPKRKAIVEPFCSLRDESGVKAEVTRQREGLRNSFDDTFGSAASPYSVTGDREHAKQEKRRRINEVEALKHRHTGIVAGEIKNQPLGDALTRDLACVLVGSNPGKMSAAHNHAYKHPTNQFWHLLHDGLLTDRLVRPEEDKRLPEMYQLGLTNLHDLPTVSAADLKTAEYVACVPRFIVKMQVWKPSSVAFVGKAIWENVHRGWRGRKLRADEFHYGWQTGLMGAIDGWSGAKVFVLPSTSGQAQNMSYPDKTVIFRELGDFVREWREMWVGNTDTNS